MNNNLHRGVMGRNVNVNGNGNVNNDDAAIISGSDFYDHEQDDSDSSSSISMDYSRDGDGDSDGDVTNRNWNNSGGGGGLGQIVEEGARVNDDDNEFDGGGGFHFNYHNGDAGGDMDADDDDDEDEDEENKTRKYKIPNIDPLYNPNGDDEDEAYVYKHLRSGLEEKVNIRKTTSKATSANTEASTNKGTISQKQQKGESSSTSTIETANQTNSSQSQQLQRQQCLEQAKILKPRNSDGVLSCPCCFQIVCMDCQKHDKYSNQYRAMFVMNIGVDWNATVTPDHIGKKENNTVELATGSDDDNNDDMNDNGNDSVNVHQSSNKKMKPIPTDEEQIIHEASLNKGGEDVYYSVYCNNCQTQVAALDMRDEVYHFFGCIVSG
eukprot:CAMPEP_0203664636 /NCGR_PEP_ID=MMETSP0090-20130426/2033_1 /ASSEMBLY_ACC=CAM_ASM_001088 /TAXON_ID=426623 /ORGANISM="Chaetoceros affinis, Strain CCMP159" /LENGTH=379 /DNA_ID=CAMNT_0050527969 /DNA_START=90 /DNA_END=1229 /DNA_ORIENTATION=-